MIRYAIIVALCGVVWILWDRGRRERATTAAIAGANAVTSGDAAKAILDGVLVQTSTPSEALMRRVNGPGVDSFTLATTPAAPAPKYNLSSKI
jgi:hypothetical protein